MKAKLSGSLTGPFLEITCSKAALNIDSRLRLELGNCAPKDPGKDRSSPDQRTEERTLTCEVRNTKLRLASRG